MKNIHIYVWYNRFYSFLEVKVLKKYLVTSIVVGAIFLTGCDKDEKASLPLPTSVDEQIIEKESVIAPVPLVLTLAQKEHYYKEYLAIVNQLNEKYGTSLKLDPITTFSADYWLELKDFEEMLKGRIDTSYVVIDNKEVFLQLKYQNSLNYIWGHIKQSFVLMVHLTPS